MIFSVPFHFFLYSVYSLLVFFKAAFISSLLLFYISLIAFVYILAIISTLPCTHNYVSLCSNPATIISHRVYGITRSTAVLRLAVSAYLLPGVAFAL